MTREPGTYVTNSTWNTYQTNINGIDYDVYVLHHETALKPKMFTLPPIYQVYMDANCTDECIENINKTLKSNKWELKTLTEVVPAGDFKDPFEAFNSYNNMKVGTYNPFI